jgi:phosphoribosylamine--glycine ligase
VVVVGAAEGYPGSYPKDRDISLPVDEDQAWIIHAGTKQLGDRLVTSGGRVLGAVGVAEDFPAARQVAYALLDQVQFEGMHHRRDIGAGFEES